MTPRRVAALGALMVAIGPVCMALYTPAMPRIAADLGVSTGQVQATLTLFFAGFAVAQLVAGPLSDALGRRPVVLGFMAIFLIGSALAMLAGDVALLQAGRLLQGVGAAAGVTTARAIVRDLFRGEPAARIMNTIGVMLGVAPAVAPTLGALILMAADWRATFVAMAAFGLVVTLASTFALRETGRPDARLLHPGRVAGAYRQVLRSRHFVLATLVVAGGVGTLYAQATMLPFILMDGLGLSPPAFGAAMLLQSGSFLAGALLMRRLMQRISAYRLAALGLALIFVGGLGEISLLWGAPGFWRIMVPVALFALGAAFVMPAMSTAALAPFPHLAGSASALMGFAQMGFGLVVGSAATVIGDPLLALATLLPGMGAVACLAYLAHRRLPPIDLPEPRRDVLGAAPPGRSLLPDDE